LLAHGGFLSVLDVWPAESARAPLPIFSQIYYTIKKADLQGHFWTFLWDLVANFIAFFSLLDKKTPQGYNWRVRKSKRGILCRFTTL
jgi:hypothetical protein